ncbi:MAG: hydantoinase/oxoprolinase family protein [Pseudomonadota bacterium]
MMIALGIDTGGTYTDAVLVEDEETVIAAAKALTTRHDLAVGIGEAVEAVLRDAKVDAGQIRLASLSTTLATNALIEGQGERIGLVLVGFDEASMQRHGLADALNDEPYCLIAGGHDHAGNQACALDEEALRVWLSEQEGAVSAFAVAAEFATRNAAHERRVQEIIAELTGKPASCSHHLSSKLNGPKRALTAVLNARLIGMIDRLITRARSRLRDLGIDAPLMVVRGDGALISTDLALERPIETILSGPAASIVGARWMTGASDAIVSDIGGTTTDVAVLRDGRPSIDPQGARVGAFRTMVEAVAMRTTGLGGDSEVHVVTEGLEGGLTLGPRRVLPVSLIATMAPALVQGELARQLSQDPLPDHFARFVVAIPGGRREGLRPRDLALLERIGDQVHPVGAILKSRLEHSALKRLVDRGLVQLSFLTPTDASHLLGTADAWDRDAAAMGLALLARQRIGSGEPLAASAEDLARRIVDQLTYQTSVALLETAFAEEKDCFGLPPQDLARHVLTERGLRGHRGMIRLDAGIALPVIGLGASAPIYYPAVGERLHCPMSLPQHAHVANAIGAVVGRVTIRRSASVTSPAEGLYRVHLETGPKDFTEVEVALAFLEGALSQSVGKAAEMSGAEEIQISTRRDVRTARVENRDVFFEAEVSAEAHGRPRIAS